MASSGTVSNLFVGAQPGATENYFGALAPNSGVDYLLPPQALDKARALRSRSEVRAAPRSRPRARALWPLPPTGRIRHAWAASPGVHPRLALPSLMLAQPAAQEVDSNLRPARPLTPPTRSTDPAVVFAAFTTVAATVIAAVASLARPSLRLLGSP